MFFEKASAQKMISSFQSATIADDYSFQIFFGVFVRDAHYE